MLTATVYPPITAPQSSVFIYDNLFDFQTESYSHTISATVGYDSMSMSIMVHETEMRDWLTHGLGRRIEVVGPSGIIWEGFVNEISLTSGPTQINVGPLLDIANKIKVSYTTKTYNTNPPIGGQPAETSFDSNLRSQDLWGTFEEILTGGEGVAATMEAMRSVSLSDMAFPKLAQDLSPDQQNPNAISLSCLGYYHYLDRYYFTDAITTGLVDINVKLADTLDADPDDLFTSQEIEPNELEVPAVEDGTRSGLTIIKELVGYGFSGGRRALLMVGAGRKVVYKPMELDRTPKYVYSPYDQYPALSLGDGTDTKPWDIVPGEWVEFESLTARPIDTSLPRDSDPRFMFIESVTFSTPNGIRIAGGKGATLKEKLDQLSLGLR